MKENKLDEFTQEMLEKIGRLTRAERIKLKREWIRLMNKPKSDTKNKFNASTSIKKSGRTTVAATRKPTLTLVGGKLGEES